jgi:stearoyl-CoA desaturase (delta-9 desaturase)
MVILCFFAAHYMLSIFCQTFFLHRYASHRMFTMSKGWERFFHLLTYVSQGASYLNPRGYALLHRLHHAYSDTKKDPHSPTNHTNVFTMMWKTKTRYENLTNSKELVAPQFDGDVPEWPLIDNLGKNRLSSVVWFFIYVAIYATFATAAWQWLLFPATLLMGPIHGAIVNWCGHKYGYRNFNVTDESRNTLPFDFVTWGELFQNNHHRFGTRANFAVRWFEIDPTYQVMRVLAFFGIIRMAPSEVPNLGEKERANLHWNMPVPAPKAIKEA